MTDVCATGNSPLLSVPAARRRIAASLRAIDGTEPLPLKQALGRILSDTLYSPLDLPPERNSAVDGYAFQHNDVAGKPDALLRLAGASWAGTPFNGILQTGECVRIFTGAVIPEGADSVVMQEQVTRQGDYVQLPAGFKSRRNIRERGEDIGKGARLLAAGTRLTAIDLGVLAAAGISAVMVRRRLQIAYFSTGDELTPLGQPLPAGKIYDSNRYLLHGLFSDAAFAATDLGAIGDDKIAIRQLMTQAADHFDVIISTGGASVGDADFIQEILSSVGQVEFWKIAIKPGKPLAFGNIGNCLFFGLPGNPVAVLVTYHQIVAPALKLLAGTTGAAPLQLRATCLSALRKKPGRMEFQRGILHCGANGELTVTAAGAQGSHLLAAASTANCYIILAEENGGVSPGETVTVEPFLNFT